MPRKPRSYDLRLADILTFLAVHSRGSVTGAARSLGTTPSQVSKAIARLERQVGDRLLSRSSQGVTLTPAATQALPHFNTAVEALLKARRGASTIRDITVAAPSYLLLKILPALAKNMTTLRFRGVQLSPAAIRAQLGLRQFEIAFSVGESSRLPASWKAEPLADLRLGLFGPPALAKRLANASTDQLLDVPFITPVSFTNGSWQPVEDECPLLVGERQAGHEAPTIAVGLALAAETEQLVFGPQVAAREALEQGRLVEIPVPGWDVRQPSFLTIDVDRVTQRELSLVKSIAQAVLLEV